MSVIHGAYGPNGVPSSSFGYQQPRRNGGVHPVKLREVTLDDLDLYVAMRCDPAMMAELGGPLPRDGVPDKLRRDVEAVQRDEAWISVIESDQGEAMGSIVLWTVDDEDGEPYSEIGWMVLPGFQGRGVGKAATAALIERAHADGRWGAIHAHPGITNAPSNGICRSLGFHLVGQVDVVYEQRTLTTNDWRLDPPSDPAPATTPATAKESR